MSDNARPVLYDADYSAILASRASGAAPQLSRVVGKHCESGDIVVRDVYLPEDVAAGDLLAVPGTGATAGPSQATTTIWPGRALSRYAMDQSGSLSAAKPNKIC